MLELCGDYRENVRRVDEVLRVRENFDIIKKAGAWFRVCLYGPGFCFHSTLETK